MKDDTRIYLMLLLTLVSGIIYGKLSFPWYLEVLIALLLGAMVVMIAGKLRLNKFKERGGEQ